MTPADQQHFLHDLRAAVIAGVPIDTGLRSDRSIGLTENLLTLKSLDTIEAQAKSGGGNLDQNNLELVLPDRLVVAQQVLSATNDMPLVLRALSTATLASRKAVRYLRWTISYLLIVLLVAWLGMLFFSMVLVPEIEAMRADMRFSRQPEVATSDTFLPWIGYLSWIFGGLLLIALIGLSVGGIRRFVMLAGGRHFVRSRMEAMATEVSARLVDAGIDSAQAHKLAQQIVGAEATSNEPARATQQLPFDSMDAPNLASLHLQNGDRTLNRIRATVPTILVFLIGGCIALVYSAAVFAPVLDLLRDLVISGV